MDKLELKEWLLKNCENPKINLYIGSNKYIKTFYYYCEKELNDIKSMADVMGASYAQSSIHLNIWFGDYSKSKGLLAFMNLCGIDEETLKEESIYLGDALNDEEMFKLIPNSIGMKSVLDKKEEFKTLPKYISSYYGGDGFAEALDNLKKN